MIYLIGGAPRCGKTTIAQQLSKSLRVSWISADAIESIVASHTPKKDLPKLFPKGVIRHQTRQSNDLMYEQYSTQEITDVYIRQSKASWRAIRVLIECSIKEGHDFIIEGHQIHPQLIAQLKEEFKGIKGLIIVRTDLDAIVSGALKSTAPNDWFIQKTKNIETYSKMGLMIQAYSQYFIEESSKYHIKVIATDNHFRQQLKKAKDYLID